MKKKDPDTGWLGRRKKKAGEERRRNEETEKKETARVKEE
jgi:hypothetical protein